MASRVPRIARLVVLSSVVAVAGASMAVDRTPRREVSRAELAGFAIGSGDPGLALQVALVDGRIASASPATQGEGQLRAIRSGEDASPMLTISGSLPVAVKFDLYLSPDGERFHYTSSCVLTPGISSFEMWQHPVREFALGNPRVVEDGKVRCE